MNLFDALFDCDPTRPLLTHAASTHAGSTNAGAERTYGEVADHARRIGAALLADGLEPGDRLIAQTTKSVDGWCLWLGCLAVGVIYVPTNTAYTPAEIRYFAKDAGASLIVVDSAAAGTAATELGATVIELAEIVGRANELRPAKIAAAPADAPAALVYTSGTTGRPKGATLTHGCILDNARALADVWEMQPDDELLHALPIFHVHGLFISLNPTLLRGARVRLLDRFAVDTVLDGLATATVFMGVPTYYHRLLADERFTADLCAPMRLFTSGSAPMTEQVHAEFTATTGRQIVERYGMSEAGIITSNRIGDVVAGSVGTALPGYEVRIVDEDGHAVEAGSTGTVEVRGPSLCAGYWGRPDADAATRTSDGWFNTGDVGSMDHAGRLTLEGRMSDMIISGGLNIYPKEIELVLDAVDGITESAVVGHADDDFGEQVVAYLVLEPGVDIEALALADVLAPLARFKHPRTWHTIDELPRNAMGKVQKNLLRAEASER